MNSEDKYLMQRAIICTRIVLSHDVHSRNAMLDALSAPDYAPTPVLQKLIESSKRAYGPKFTIDIPGGLEAYRHCNERGMLVHIWHWSDYEGMDCTEECVVEHQLIYRCSGIVMLRL